MSSFSPKGLLAEREQLVMLAIGHLGDDAYPVSIRDLIEARTGMALRRGGVYEALERLERRGYLRSALAGPTADRGGRVKRVFVLTAAGQRALADADRIVARMKGALRPAGGGR